MNGPVLLAQEFGANLGHVTRLVAVAKALGLRRPVFAVPDPAVARSTIFGAFGDTAQIVGGHRFSAPRPARSPSQGDRTLGDALFHLGYSHIPSLAWAAQRWRDLIDHVRPSLMITDFAPTVRLACWDRIPMVVLGGAYESPPPDRPIPTASPFGQEPPQDSLDHEGALFDAAQTVRAGLGGPPLTWFADLFQGDANFPAAPPGCDAYARYRARPASPPIGVPDIRSGPPLRERRGPDVFAYLWSEHQHLELILTALNGLDRRSEIHVRGIEPERLAAQCGPQIGIHTREAAFATLLPQARLFIHYGGMGAAYSSLLAGTPQLIVPVHLEQEITATGMAGQGVAVGLKLGTAVRPEDLRSVIVGQLENTGQQEKALALAKAARAERPTDPLADIVSACRRLAPRSQD